MVDYFALEWPHDVEDYFHRQAAQTVAVNGRQEALLVHGHDFSGFTHRWWFIVGGGVRLGEAPHEVAVRELPEETGHRLKTKVLTGPVLRRHATFDFHQLTCRRDEDFFFARISSALQFSRAFEIGVGKQVIDELKWWDLTELEGAIACGTVAYPPNFVPLVRGWLRGWNRETIETSKGIVLPER